MSLKKKILLIDTSPGQRDSNDPDTVKMAYDQSPGPDADGKRSGRHITPAAEANTNPPSQRMSILKIRQGSRLEEYGKGEPQRLRELREMNLKKNREATQEGAASQYEIL